VTSDRLAIVPHLQQPVSSSAVAPQPSSAKNRSDLMRAGVDGPAAAAAAAALAVPPVAPSPLSLSSPPLSSSSSLLVAVPPLLVSSPLPRTGTLLVSCNRCQSCGFAAACPRTQRVQKHAASITTLRSSRQNQPILVCALQNASRCIAMYSNIISHGEVSVAIPSSSRSRSCGTSQTPCPCPVSPPLALRLHDDAG
jgi:hypothetical protein